MPILLTLIAAVASYVVSASMVISKLGMGEGAIAWIAISATPFVMLGGLAAMFRKRMLEGWLVLAGTIICSAVGFQGIYAAFYSDRPHDPWIVMFRPVAQVGVVLVTAIAATIIYFVRKKRPNQSPEPMPLTRHGSS